MLTKHDKERIKAEEIFREEIKKKLSESEKKSFNKNLWQFINSSFGVWLLSTVVVGLIAYFYNDNKSKNEISANNSATLQKLETETINRLQRFRSALINQDPSAIYYQKAELVYMIDGVLISDGSYAQRKPIYIFPEYKERTMNSLLYEIGRLTNDKVTSSNITDARKILTKIQYRLLNMENPPDPDFSFSQAIQQKSQSGQSPLSFDEQQQLAEYQQKKKSFEEGPLTQYYMRIKKDLDSSLTLFQNNAFLKRMSAE